MPVRLGDKVSGRKGDCEMAAIAAIMDERLNRRRLSLLGMAVVTGGFLAACGDDDDDDDEVNDILDEDDDVEEATVTP